MFRKTFLTLMGTVAAIILVQSVFAEGSWSSTLNARSGFNSRTWTDNNIGFLATTIRFDTCRDSITGNEPNDRAEIQLTRETPWWQPDESQGRKTLRCFNSDKGNWGIVPQSNYHFTIISVSGVTDSWNFINTPFVQVEY